ncbi:MAG: AAA family ATPase [Acidobacteriota bacterium]|nr:AAA family ATPase [Acidobacteriota bacterium]
MLTIEIPDPSLVLLIGSSGAGKSTFAARHFSPTEVVSSDRCRALICDDESDQSINAQTFALLHHIARLRLAQQRLTVIDATNLRFRARRPLLRIARRFRLPIIAIVFNIPLATCLANNQHRQQRKVAPEVLQLHAGQLTTTRARLEREGYERIYWLDEMEMLDGQIEKIRQGN